MTVQPQVLLIDLPTFPKGSVALSLYAVAAALTAYFEPHIVDLNCVNLEAYLAENPQLKPAWIGLKVSAQNFDLAIAQTQALRAHFGTVPIIWGGELPTLLPEDCLQHCDTIVSGAFEPIAAQLAADFASGTLSRLYRGATQPDISTLLPPRLDLIPKNVRYPQFMGLPMESSRGCTYKCTFCMVHTMQPGYQLKTEAQLAAELPHYAHQFLNLVDYNFGVSEAHILKVAAAIGSSQVLGWMGEMCIESLDNDRILEALAQSRCRMIYCGLEAVDELGLKSINKGRTNVIGNYERIIRKVQRYGIQIAAGMIIGLDGASPAVFAQMQDFFQRMGIIYVKLTFLTYNPGTKVNRSMLRKGSYLTEDIQHFDGNHITYLAEGLEPKVLVDGTKASITRFYSIRGILQRSFNVKMSLLARLEFLCFNLCYREAYLNWLQWNVFDQEANFQALLAAPFKRSATFRWADRWLHRIRKWRA